MLNHIGACLVILSFYCHKTTTVIGSLMVGLVEGYNKCLFGRVCGIGSTTFSK